MDPGGAHQLLVRRRRIRQASPSRCLLALGAFPGEGMDGGREAEREEGQEVSTRGRSVAFRVRPLRLRGDEEQMQWRQRGRIGAKS